MSAVADKRPFAQIYWLLSYNWFNSIIVRLLYMHVFDLFPQVLALTVICLAVVVIGLDTDGSRHGGCDADA